MHGILNTMPKIIKVKSNWKNNNTKWIGGKIQIVSKDEKRKYLQHCNGMQEHFR